MRIALTVLTPKGAQDVLLSADGQVSAGQIAEALRETFRSTEPTATVTPLRPAADGTPPSGAPVADLRTLWVDGRPVPPETPAGSLLRDGSVITADPEASSATVLSEPTGMFELRVAGGPDAGAVHRLGLGRTVFGSGPQCHVRLRAPGVAPVVGTLTVSAGAPEPWFEPAPAGPNAAGSPLTLLDGDEVSAARPWPIGGVLRTGSAVLSVRRPEAPDAYLSPSDDGGLAYDRPPRLRAPAGTVTIEVPTKPKRSPQTQMLLVGMTVPLVIGGVMVWVTGQLLFALFMLMSPLMMLSQWVSTRGSTGGPYRKRKREYREKMAGLDAKLAAARARDEATRRDDNLDPTQILLTATGPRRRLWERRADDADVLRLRVGTVDAPSRVQVVRESGAEADPKAELPPVPTSFCVPLAIPLPQLGVLGLAGPLQASRNLARWFVAQAAVMHAPSDLSIVVLTSQAESGRYWNWVRWLPHNVPRNGQDCISLVGVDLESSARRAGELADEVTARLAVVTESGGGLASGADGFGPGPNRNARPVVADSALGPKILVVLDGARALRRLPGMALVLANSRTTGVYAICIDETLRTLPEECAAVLSWDAAGGAPAQPAQPATPTLPSTLRMRGSGLEQVPPVLADQVTVAWANRVARALAPVRDVSREESASGIPESVRLLDLIHLPNPSPELVLAAWKKYGRSTRAPVGVDGDGVFVIDVNADGPHGLIAGTTGAGKSEFLQTLIASLAVLNRPESMNFVLIDYKGGSAFKNCAQLPHTVGMVTDLDGHLTIRALDSLGAELKRREELLLHAGAKDIDDYWDTKTLQPDLEPMPRLVLVIDEFAAMVSTLPDFVTGLIDIARRGRSLGVHLMLATQRPAGVVSADIQANTNLRVALRVTSADDSADVLDTGDAAHISKSTPGRCYVRSGAGRPVAVQSARVGGRRPGVGPASAQAEIVRVPWRTLGRGLAAPAAKGDGEIDLATDLSVLTTAIVEANERAGYGSQRRPWLEPLPELLTLDDLPEVGPSRADIAPIPFGVVDLPMRQARAALTLDFADAGHTAVAGAAHTGRSTLLRTLAGSIARQVSPADVHIYGIDCGTGALLPVAELPHCGAVAPREQPERIERLLGKLRAEVNRRQQQLAAEGFTGLLEQRAATGGVRLPWMVLLIDWWEGYLAAFEQYDFGRLVDDVLQLLREGSAVGLRAVVTTDRAALIGQSGSVFGRRMLLRLSDRGDASLADIGERSLPTNQSEGRLMFPSKPHPLEAQVALLDPDPAGLAQARAIRDIAAQAGERFGPIPVDLRPLRVDALPTRITVPQTLRLDESFVPPSPLWAMVGAGGDELGPVGLDVGSEGPGLVVAGPARSGRSTALVTMAQSLLRAQTPIMIITPRRSPLRSLEDEPGVLAVRGADFDVEEMRSLLNPLPRYVVIVDDAEMLHDAPGSEVLERIVLTGRDTDHGLILAGSTSDLGRVYTGFIAAALKSRCGVLVSVQSPEDGDLFHVRLPRNARPGPLGRGLIVRPGHIAPIQIPVVDDI